MQNLPANLTDRLEQNAKTTRHNVNVLSASSPAWSLLHGSAQQARVLGHFRRVVDLEIAGEILALVTPGVGNGPFHAVVDHLPQRRLPRQLPLHRDGSTLHVGPWALSLDPPPTLWDPMPDWPHLTPEPEALAALVGTIRRAAAQRRRSSPFAAAIFGEAPPGVAALFRGIYNEGSALVCGGAARLAGLGPGLTPSGDDFLAGVMLALWLRYRRPVPALAWIYEAAAHRTTRLSRAFLRAARDGHADARWHALLAALSGASRTALEAAAHAVLDFGATSGLDMLAGFVLTLETLARSHVRTYTLYSRRTF